MPTWVVSAQYDQFYLGQPEQVVKALKSSGNENTTLHEFMGPAGYHAQAGAINELNRALFAWLDPIIMGV